MRRKLGPILVVVLTLSQCAACHGAEAESARSIEAPEAAVQFPLEFDVAPRNRLYLDGELVEHVCMTSVPGDSLYLNGVPILPRRHREIPWYEPPSDDDYLRWVGEAPARHRSRLARCTRSSPSPPPKPAR